ncbi:MAG: AMP-binding protein [Candidatus Woesearchaeota archaeon]
MGLKTHSTIRELVDNFEDYENNVAISYIEPKTQEFKEILYKEIKDNAISIANFIHELKLNKQERGIVLSGNNPLWTSAVWGMQYYGLSAVPIDFKERGENNSTLMIKHSKSKLLFVENEETLHKLKTIEKKKYGLLKGIKEIILFNPNENELSLDNIVKKNSQPNDFNIVNEKDIASIFYTSGTTGRPSGVMLTHGNLLFNAYATLQVEPMFEEVFVSMLPLSHSFGNIESIISAITKSRSHYSSVNKLMEDLRSQKPTKLVNSPKLLDKIVKKVDENLSEKKLTWLPDFFKYKLAGKKIKYKLGGNVTGIFVGGSKLTRDVQRKFWLMGIDVKQGYGTTEASPICTAPQERKYPGSIGLPLPGTQAIILEGELYVKGPHVMKGYFDNPQKTREKLINGWYKTGDLATKNRKGWFYITGRKEDSVKLNNGFFVNLINIEKTISMDPFVEEVLAIGYERDHVATIIIPNEEKLKKYFKKNNIDYDLKNSSDELREIYFNVISQRTKKLDKNEIPKQILLISPDHIKDAFSFKKELRRNFVVSQLENQIEELYSSKKKILSLYK